MKKFLCLAAAAAVLALLSGCSSIPKYQNEKGTPEDSVVLYGLFMLNERMVFSQMDPRFSPDNLDFQINNGSVTGFIVTKPLKPGTTYRWQYAGGKIVVQGGNFKETTYWMNYYPMNIQYMDIKVPNKPGVYFLGVGNTSQTVLNNRMIFMEDTKGGVLEKISYGGFSSGPGPVLGQAHMFELWALDVALKAYEGTSWENLLQERMNAIKDEKQE